MAEIRQANFFGGEAHTPDDTSEDGILTSYRFASAAEIGDRNQHFTCRLFVMPSPFDRGKFRRLIVDVIAGEVSEKDLGRTSTAAETGPCSMICAST